jgi:hypothetical protein
MTELQWLHWTNTEEMLKCLERRRASDRKLRLFATSCCRRIASLLPVGESDESILVAERFADGDASETDLSAACGLAEGRAFEAIDRTPSSRNDPVAFNAFSALENALSHPNRIAGIRTATMASYATWAAQEAAEATAYAVFSVKSSDLWKSAFIAEQAAQAGLLRCVFGNPFRPARIEPSWLRWCSCLLVSMARQMYDSRDFTDMPVLADALEEAGCQDQDILGHCRSGGEHVRGCWVIDLLLGRS